jgi:predicted AlkP superfamily pyrophosphatase or phosphodiesterase
MLTQTAPGIATIATGCEPIYHGVVSDYWYQRLKRNSTFSVFNTKMKTVGTDNDIYPFAPTNLLSTTFSDELKLFNNNKSKVIGISFKPESAVLSVGHLGNTAYWFDYATGRWITSSYYCDLLPSWVRAFNDKKIPDIYINREWTPILSKNKYRDGEESRNSQEVGFLLNSKSSRRSRHRDKENPYSILKSTPYGVTLTKDFAISAILDENLGKDEYTDYLSISFSSVAEISKVCGINSIELEDAYVRLDRDLGHLLKFLEENIGKHNFLVYLTSDHGASYSPDELKEKNIPAGTFNSDRAIMLLRTYMNAVYGHGKWVPAYHNKQIYLNHQLIEDSKLNLSDVQDVASKFILQFSGVANVITSTVMDKTYFDTGIFSYMQNSYNQKRSGDVFINLNPGWIEMGRDVSLANSAYKYDIHVPLIWYGWKIKRDKISRPIKIEDIAPTISNMLKIPTPNSSTGQVIDELIH